VDDSSHHEDEPGVVETLLLIEKLIYNLKRQGSIRSQHVEDAFRAVPRHYFLPGVDLREVYSFNAVTTKCEGDMPISSSSQPPRMATMLEQLDLNAGQQILEVGAGTGYNAGLIGKIVGETGRVVTLDIDEDIVEGARKHLELAGIENVDVICGDGGFGYPPGAPYDRVILSVGAWDISPKWVEQLKPDGILLLPLWIRGEQRTIAFERKNDHLESVSIERCGFVRLRGKYAGSEKIMLLDKEANLHVSVDNADQVDIEKQITLLNTPSLDTQLEVLVSMHEIIFDVSLWMAVHEPKFFNLTADGDPDNIINLPFLFGYPGIIHSTYGVRSDSAISLLVHPLSITKDFSKAPEDDDRFFPVIVTFGSDQSISTLCSEQIQKWVSAGRPTTTNLSIKALPIGNMLKPTSNWITHKKSHFEYKFRWMSEGTGV